MGRGGNKIISSHFHTVFSFGEGFFWGAGGFVFFFNSLDNFLQMCSQLINAKSFGKFFYKTCCKLVLFFLRGDD
jgi:hypothetical protein